MTALLSVQDLRAGYGSREVVQGVSFGVEEGEICVLLGANGAGKSTTLGAIVGSVRRMAGHIRLAGADVTRAETADNVRAGISLVPEGARTFRDFSVDENLMLGAYTVGDAQTVRQRLDYVRHLFPILASRRRQRAGTLSGGERQMLAIGRALMIGPKVLLLDEPFLGLSPAMCETVLEAISQINRERVLALLVVEQNPLILNIADRALVMQLGEIVVSEDDPRRLAEDGRLQAIYLT